MAKKDKVQPRREVTKRRLARWQKERRRRRVIVAAGLLVIIVISAIIGYGFYDTSIAPGRELITTIKGIEEKSFYGSDYENALALCEIGFCPSSGDEREDPILFLEINELVSQGADEANIIITNYDVTQGIKDMLFPDEEEIDYERYNQMLSNMGLSNEEFREIVKTNVLREKLSEVFLNKVPQSAEQVHMEAILGVTEEEAAEVMGNLSEGEDFSSLAAKLGGGDLGWLPREIMIQEFDEVAFDPDLELDTVKPFDIDEVWYIIRVLEREEDRAIDEVMRDQLAASEFSSWLEEDRESKVDRNWKYDQDNPKYMENLENLYQRYR